jgi:type I restriction enzyme M protein
MSNIAELRNAVWQACTAIRKDHRDVKKYVEYTAILLFFKFYDDVFETLPADIQGLIPVEYRWRTLRSLDPRGFAGFHPQVLLRLRDFFTNKRWARKFGVIFDNLQFDIKHDEVLGKALIALDRVDFAGLSYDQKGAIYEFLIARMADAGVKGEFFTPRPIVDMIIEILKPQAGQRIWDPACGTGGFLSRAFEEMRADLGRKFREGSLEYQNGLHQLRYQCIYGNETESVSARLARMNMILRGDGHSTILEFNSLDRLTYTEPVLELRGEEENNPIPDILSDGGFDLIMANPPYGGSQAVCDVGGSFKPWVKSAKPEANFLQVMMHSLKPGGRCAVLMPEGVLFRPHEKKIRERLLKDFHLEAVIGLFKGAFEFADVKACVLVFSRPKGGQKGFKTQQVWVAETETFDDIRVIPGLIGSTAENGTARVVSLDEIQKAGLILRPGKFLKTRQTSQEPTLVPLSQVVKENKSTITISDSDGYRRISVALYVAEFR